MWDGIVVGLWILGISFAVVFVRDFVGSLREQRQQSQMRSDISTWSDEKIKARQNYLLCHGSDGGEEKQALRDEMEKRWRHRCAVSAADKWAEYEAKEG